MYAFSIINRLIWEANFSETKTITERQTENDRLKTQIRIQKKNYSSKLQSKGVGKTKMTGVRKVGRGN